ncbi:MAG: transcription termination factor NusA [Candidatus Marinimicrobia bacterium]|nr:transcription termination factor NusA [Candidatus Neomarinimicrobiota bacterium]
MINRELIEVFSEIAREKNVERSELGSIIEQLFLYIIEKQRGDSENCSVIVNIDKGEIEIYAERKIVNEVEDPTHEIALSEVRKLEPDLEDLDIGEDYIEVIDPIVFGRRLVATAKQFFAQRIQDVEKKYIFEDYNQRVGEIIIGTVHQVQKDNIYINIEHAELRMPRREQIQSERYRRGDTIRAIIKSVDVTPKGPDILVSRSSNQFLYKLFEMEVPEIEDGIIDITTITRQPGERAKIIVKSQDRRIDAVGACVGMRGSRIQAIVRELSNEKIDIINHSEQPEILISRALSPAKPINLYIDDDRRYCDAIFGDNDLDTAIGKGGVNINLAARVTGYRIDAYGKTEYEKQQNDQNTLLKNIPDFSTDLAQALSKGKINLVSEALNTDEDTLLTIEGVTAEAVELMYDAIQNFIERSDVDEDEIGFKFDLESTGTEPTEINEEQNT